MASHGRGLDTLLVSLQHRFFCFSLFALRVGLQQLSRIALKVIIVAPLAFARHHPALSMRLLSYNWVKRADVTISALAVVQSSARSKSCICNGTQTDFFREGLTHLARKIFPSYFPRLCSVGYVQNHARGIYPGYYPTKNFCKFCRTFIPVPGTSVSSVRH